MSRLVCVLISLKMGILVKKEKVSHTFGGNMLCLFKTLKLPNKYIINSCLKKTNLRKGRSPVLFNLYNVNI